MQNITDKVIEIIKKEEHTLDVEKLERLDALTKKINKISPKKSTYSLPLADTIGKTYYTMQFRKKH